MQMSRAFCFDLNKQAAWGRLDTSQRISKVMEDDENSWRAPGFRQEVLAQIENAVNRSGNPSMRMKNPSEMENQVYSKANSKVQYLAHVARLLVYIRDIRPSGQQQPQPSNMASQSTTGDHDYQPLR
ncbi:mediator of RNA polymerase II transcription subunit 15-like [Acropora palmata]|uniref:mediator of RNA polymerase II transcription subunit 15-like n=1 Tax=Acropora palmata TaxID=6131 RepID=UPI003DA11547